MLFESLPFHNNCVHSRILTKRNLQVVRGREMAFLEWPKSAVSVESCFLLGSSLCRWGDWIFLSGATRIRRILFDGFCTDLDTKWLVWHLYTPPAADILIIPGLSDPGSGSTLMHNMWTFCPYSPSFICVLFYVLMCGHSLSVSELI